MSNYWLNLLEVQEVCDELEKWFQGRFFDDHSGLLAFYELFFLSWPELANYSHQIRLGFTNDALKWWVVYCKPY